MSSFLGLMKEIPGISVDHFEGENLNSSAYFLSHYHTDHMKGLNSFFLKHLEQCNKYIYCSPVSKVYLETDYSTYSCIRDIPVNEKVLIEYKQKDRDCNIFVTCIASGHCPGSVMFLFEKENSELILYTGDFRINPLDYKKIAPLHFDKGINKFRKEIAAMYLDTTLLNPNFAFVPTRKESVNVICKAVGEWLDKSSRNAIVLKCSARYGSEFLYIELAKFFNMRIYVNDFVYKSSRRIPDLACHITNDMLSTRIYACMNKKDSLDLTRCRDISNENILTIVASILRWDGRDTSMMKEWNFIKNTLNVCYSTHASFDELKAFIHYFRPKQSYPCVIPPIGIKHNCALNLFRHVVDEIANKIKEENDNTVQNENNRKKYTLQISNDEDVVEPWTEYYFT